MLAYTAAYVSLEEGGYECKVLDFPGANSGATTLRGARRMLQDALVKLALGRIERGQPLPTPNAEIETPEAEIVEPIYLLLTATSRLPIGGEVDEPE